MAVERIHYKTGGKIEYSGVEVLPDGKDIEVIITKVEFAKNIDVQGKKKENVWLAHFAPNEYAKLPMIINSTNRKRLAKLAKQAYINLIIEFPVYITQEEARDPSTGDMVMGLRISKIPHKLLETKPFLSSSHPAWKDCVKYVAGDKAKVADIRKKYFVFEDVEEELVVAFNSK